MSVALSSLPETVCQALYTDIVIEDVTISGDDQIQMMQIFSGMDRNDTEAALQQMDNLPDSVYGLIKPSININQTSDVLLQ